VAAITSRTFTASACVTAHRDRVGTDSVRIPASAAGSAVWTVLDAKKPSPCITHPIGVQNHCYVLDVVQLHLNALLHHRCRVTEYFAFWAAYLLISDKHESADGRLLAYGLLEIAQKLLLDFPEPVQSHWEVHGSQALESVPLTQDVRPTISPSERMDRIDGCVAIEV
jgi:hypothetical protein